jgi:hypothetical protein
LSIGVGLCVLHQHRHPVDRLGNDILHDHKPPILPDRRSSSRTFPPVIDTRAGSASARVKSKPSSISRRTRTCCRRIRSRSETGASTPYRAPSHWWMLARENLAWRVELHELLSVLEPPARLQGAPGFLHAPRSFGRPTTSSLGFTKNEVVHHCHVVLAAVIRSQLAVAVHNPHASDVSGWTYDPEE